MPWDPGDCPFPDTAVAAIEDFKYENELHMVRHHAPPDDAPDSLWQLSEDFTVSMICHPEGGGPADGFVHTVTAPRGMYTDLASVPRLFWSIIGPIGPHLEASIVHDYLYMAWTDFRPREDLERDWNFADAVLFAGMNASGVSVFQGDRISKAVHSSYGWETFSEKEYDLADRMEGWLGHL